MSLNNLFKIISREDAAVWVGAGFSLYAGYPSGVKLQQIIYNELSTEEKEQLDKNSSLRKTAGAFVTLRNGSRNELNRILRREFGQKPLDTHNHDLLSRIPHFRSIITTNYDSLIERSYTRRANVIKYDRDVPYIESLGVTIYKPHGDLESPDKIVITENDYASFHNIKRDQPFWISVLDIVIKKNILFLGYGFEDENVWSWLDLIDNAIGADRKERFLVAPDWPLLKVKQLEERHIKYFDMTAECFLEELNQYFKDNIVSDLENGIVSQTTFNEYVSFHDLNSNIIYKDGKTKLESLFKSGNKSVSTINFEIADKKLIKKLDQFTQGYGKSIKIPKEHLMSFKRSVDGFNLNTDVIDELFIARLPKKHSCSIEFPDDNLILENIEFEIYRASKNLIKISSNVRGFEVKIDQILSKDGSIFKVNYLFPKILPSVLKCIQFQNAILNIGNGRKVLIYLNGDILDITSQHLNFDLGPTTATLNFFLALKKIENKFSVTFSGERFDFSEENINKVNKISNLIDIGFLNLNLAKGVLLHRKESLGSPAFTKIPDNITSLFIKTGETVKIKLFGKEITLGENGMEIFNPIIVSVDENKNVAHIKSKSNQYHQHYSHFYNFDSVKNIEI
ncbi:hypothetical protein A0256_03140 [Mucilaginibacter sp. PAMC 26640]|nr:hypothetical protein A0256_03140 [Mucilaginibacter sp. PAMC 26640]